MQTDQRSAVRPRGQRPALGALGRVRSIRLHARGRSLHDQAARSRDMSGRPVAAWAGALCLWAACSADPPAPVAPLVVEKAAPSAPEPVVGPSPAPPAPAPVAG